MKNFGKKVFYLALLCVFITATSFFAFDYSKIKERVKEDGWESLFPIYDNNYKEEPDRSIELKEFEDLEANLENVMVEVKEDPAYSVEIFTRTRSSSYSDKVKIHQQGSKLSIEDSGNSPELKIVLKAPKWEQISANFKIENGVLSIQKTMKNLMGEIENGQLNVKASQSFPIEYKIENGQMDISMEEINANIKAHIFQGQASIFEERVSSELGDKSLIERIVGQGRDNIDLKVENGEITIKK